MAANGTMPLSPTAASTSLFNATRRVQQLEERFAEFATQTHADRQTLTNRVASLESALRQREEEIKQVLDGRAAQRAAELENVVADAKSEFERQREQLRMIGQSIEAEFQGLQQQIDGRQSGAGGYSKCGKGFLP